MSSRILVFPSISNHQTKSEVTHSEYLLDRDMTIVLKQKTNLSSGIIFMKIFCRCKHSLNISGKTCEIWFFKTALEKPDGFSCNIIFPGATLCDS